jgi:hypothetical protein
MSEWELRVSQKELHRLHVVGLTLEGRESVGRGAKLLGISVRQMKRLRRKMKERGSEGLLHGNRGKTAWNKTASQRRQTVIALARGRIRDSTTRTWPRSSRRRKDRGLARHGAPGVASGRDHCGAKARRQDSQDSKA